MLTIRAMSDGAGYSSRHLEHNDYYAENERVRAELFTALPEPQITKIFVKKAE